MSEPPRQSQWNNPVEAIFVEWHGHAIACRLGCRVDGMSCYESMWLEALYSDAKRVARMARGGDR
jgi:hypothetical protein